MKWKAVRTVSLLTLLFIVSACTPPEPLVRLGELQTESTQPTSEATLQPTAEPTAQPTGLDDVGADVEGRWEGKISIAATELTQARHIETFTASLVLNRAGSIIVVERSRCLCKDRR
jgi:hypothetical protein